MMPPFIKEEEESQAPLFLTSSPNLVRIAFAMTVEADIEGKDPMVYGDVASSGHPVETETADSSILLGPPEDVALGPQIPAQSPIETIEGV